MTHEYEAEVCLCLQKYKFRCPRDARLWSNVFATEEYCRCVFLAPECTALRCPWVSALVLPVVRVPSCARGPPDILFTVRVQQNCSMYCTVCSTVRKKGGHQPRTKFHLIERICTIFYLSYHYHISASSIVSWCVMPPLGLLVCSFIHLDLQPSAFSSSPARTRTGYWNIVTPLTKN